ncbi:MAG: hypothetical protein IJM97_01355 [Clostridia bacterium]|nr:hypothetical protein [Clostridia bacterium]
MKKVISIFLALALMMVSIVPAFAAEESDIIVATDINEVADTVDCEYPIIFVTGIGQTWTHILNEDGSFKTKENGKLVEYNLFYADIDALLTSPIHMLRALKVVGQLLSTIILDKNFVDSDDVGSLVAKVLRCNLIDENGKLPADVEDTIKRYPLSEYNAVNTKNFYRSIPCEDVVAKIGAENVFCYNYPAFSFTYDNADGLNEFIKETVLGEYSDAEKVVLVPMSMGATVVSAYLDRYGNENDVARVVSIVGAWDGSDVIADLIEAKYAENSAEMFYDSTLMSLVGDMLGLEETYKPLVVTLLDVAIRLLSKQTLRDLIDTIIEGIVDHFLIKTPSLLALIPSGRYEAIEEKYLSDPELEYIRVQTREYYEAQSTLFERLSKLEKEYGMEFYFISGYGLSFGGFEGSDYTIMKMLYSSAGTNSDEIIQISSTAPGTTFAPAGTKLENIDENNKYISPDGSIDLSTSYAPDRTWCFYEQKHELEDNNTAIRLAFDLAIGKYSSVDDCVGVYPQFNESRDVEDLTKGPSYLHQLQKYITKYKDDPAYAENVKLAQEAYDELYAMMERTINDREGDDAIKENAYDTLVALGVYPPKAEETVSWYMNILNLIVKILDQKLYDIFGTGGFKEKIFG